MRTLLNLAVIAFIVMGTALAQDPGMRDSLIIDDVYVDSGSTSVLVPVYFVLDDTVLYGNMPLIWSPSNEEIWPTAVEQEEPYLCPEVFYEISSIIRLFWFASLESTVCFLPTDYQRFRLFSLEFHLESDASPQMVTIDTTYDPINGSLAFGLIRGAAEFTPAFVPGHIYMTANAIDDEAQAPRELCLSQNHPNPFNPSTRIDFALPSRQHVSLAVFDILGNRVRTLADEEMEPRNHSVIWDAKDEGGNDVSSGIYFYRLAGDGVTDIKRMLLVR